LYISTEEDVNETMLLFKWVRETLIKEQIFEDFDEDECKIFEV